MYENTNIPAARRRVARIRCLQDCFTSVKDKKPFPDCLCYVPSEVEHTTLTKTTWKFYEEPSKSSKVVKEVIATAASRLIASGEDLCNSEGKWLKVKVFKVKGTANEEYEEPKAGGVWLLLFPLTSSTEETPAAVPVREDFAKTKTPFKKQCPIIKSWEGVVEETYSPILKKHQAQIMAPEPEAVARLQQVPEGWTLDHDASLVQLMAQREAQGQEELGCLKEYVESLGVSTYSTGDGEICNLTDGDSNTYWESDGSQGHHWIRLNMKKGTIIKSLIASVDLADDNYLPETIEVIAGETDNYKVLSSVSINWNTQTCTEIKLLENLTQHYPIVTVKIKSCKGHGIDTRIRGLKMNCLEERYLGFDEDFFSTDNLTRFPLLQPHSPAKLYRRSIILQRFMWLLDSVIQYFVPAWQISIESFEHSDDSLMAGLESVRPLLPLSKKRIALVDTILKGSASDPSDRKVVYINRHAALEHRANPAASPDLRNTVFMQLYEGLRPRDRTSSPLTYRWSTQNDQWWECKFISEGIIDQGGGFRDSLTDMAEELCPSDSEVPVALPFFIRAPNQMNEDGNMTSDVYIPNANCMDLAKFEWIGQMMGACFRGKEILILSLPQYIWKRLVGESYTWTEDFATVDAAEVKLIDNLVKMDEAAFSAAGRLWSMVLSDGSTVCIKMDAEGNPKPLAYEDREEYAQHVRRIRLSECNKQLKALRTGLLKVVPEAVLSLLTWQELETRICGQAEITVEALMKNTFYHHIDEEDNRVQMFWTAVKNFSTEDRSHLLRFITGRRRLPVSIFLTTGKNSPVDPLPESSTCSNTLHLPSYSSAKVAEEKLLYAAYNCVSIDNDE